MPLSSAHHLPRRRPVRASAVAAKIAAIGMLAAVCGSPAQGHASPTPESRAPSPTRCVPRQEHRLVIAYEVAPPPPKIRGARACPPILRGKSSTIRNARLIYR